MINWNESKYVYCMYLVKNLGNKTLLLAESMKLL